MSLVNKSKLDKKLGAYLVGPATALADPLWQTRAQDYRRILSGRMIPLDASEIKKRLPASKYHVSLKVDGEFNLLVFKNGEAITINPGGTVRTGLAMHDEAAAILAKAGFKQAIIAGEFYYARPDGKRGRVHDVSRVARQPENQAELDRLHFAVFDIVEIDGKPMPGFDDKEWKKIVQWFDGGKTIKPIEAMWLDDIKEVETQFQTWVASGAEGAVVRSEQAGQFKIKPRHTIDAVVIGFTEGQDDRQGMIHDLLLAVMRPDGTLHNLGRVGGGFTENDRRAFLSDLRDLACASDYTEVNEQIAYTMVKPEWVIEISVLDLIAQSTRGVPVTRMVLHWNITESKYEPIRRMPMVGMISPQFVRRRDDKHVNATDIRMAQISDLVEVTMVDKDARKLTQPVSAVIKRDVYTKELKGATMVRKLVMWQTNKENDDFPGYVIHFTDYSPNRKTPLERDARISNSREQIDVLWNELVAENVVKGWVKWGEAPPAKPAAKPKKKSEPAE